MKRKAYLALGAAALIGLSAMAIPALADHDHGHQGGPSQPGTGGPGEMGMMGADGDMMPMMARMHGMMGGGMMGGGMMGTDGHFLKVFDADGDGTVTPEELRTGMSQALKTYDADGNGSLAIGEFEVMHSAHIREQMVDRFQALDADGDGQVTEAEISAPADMMQMRMMKAQGGTGTDMMGNN